MCASELTCTSLTVTLADSRAVRVPDGMMTLSVRPGTPPLQLAGSVQLLDSAPVHVLVLGPPPVMLNAALLAFGAPPLDPTSVYPVPALSNVRSLNVAIPATA